MLCLRKKSDEEMRELAKEELNDSKAKSGRVGKRVKDLITSKRPER